MKKLLAETKGNIMLQTRVGLLPWNRPGIIAECSETDQFVSQGQVKVLKNDLPPEANDEDFEKFLKAHDGDWEAAVENYLHSLSGEEGEPVADNTGSTDAENKDDEGSTDAAKDTSADDKKAPAKKATSSAKAKG